jgi:hypothetical protein
MNRDPGLQPERTRLSWRRTTLSLTVVALLTIRLATSAGTIGALVAAVAGLAWVAITTVSFRHATDRHDRPLPVGGPALPPQPVGGPALPLLALGTIGYAVLGAILILDSLG